MSWSTTTNGENMHERSDEIKEAANIIADADHIISFCGAGISAESGISTFRDPGGLWDQIDPWEAGTPEGLMLAIENKSSVLMPIFNDIINSFQSADPNPGHLALATLESMGKMEAVITQNVDDLHFEAGSSKIVEVHGNLFKMRCMSCSTIRKFDRKTFLADFRKSFQSLETISLKNLISVAPKCEKCGYVMRPDVVMFGEAVQGLGESFQLVRKCDAMLVLGTSGVVYPVAEFPSQAKQNGAKIIVINPTENAFSHVSNLYIPMKTGVAMPDIVDELRSHN